MSTEDNLLNLNIIENNSETNANTEHGKRKKYLTDYFSTRNNEPKKSVASKSVQVSLGVCMSDQNFCSNLPSEKYWNLVAEKKRIELQDALDENERLHKIKESLLKQNKDYKQILEEVNSFIDVIKEIVQDTDDDTGIDVADFNESSD